MQQFLIYAHDYTDAQALERRMAARPAHFEMAKKLKASGNFIAGGAILDEAGKMIGSSMMVQFEDESQLQAWLAEEPYLLGKVWEKVNIHPFKLASL